LISLLSFFIFIFVFYLFFIFIFIFFLLSFLPIFFSFNTPRL